ncbi:hypothetical protein DPMN_010478 [Dreissena polymorpha]|uniref:Uncharacterized protein n=1 Tax=Dreissena polymorpha TaxID=45954 RepID=A0A9D4S126_DREPO|nr:hypothetical protein DPMN_010478 [Dreissena polymorpha]
MTSRSSRSVGLVVLPNLQGIFYLTPNNRSRKCPTSMRITHLDWASKSTIYERAERALCSRPTHPTTHQLKSMAMHSRRWKCSTFSGTSWTVMDERMQTFVQAIEKEREAFHEMRNIWRSSEIEWHHH